MWSVTIIPEYLKASSRSTAQGSPKERERGGGISEEDQWKSLTIQVWVVKWILTSPKGEFDEKGHTMTYTLSVTHRQKERRIPGLVWTALARSQAHSSVPTSRAVSHWATAYRYKRLASLHRTFWSFCNKTELTASRFSHIARRCMDRFFEEKKKKRKKKPIKTTPVVFRQWRQI